MKIILPIVKSTKTSKDLQWWEQTILYLPSWIWKFFLRKNEMKFFNIFDHFFFYRLPICKYSVKSLIFFVKFMSNVGKSMKKFHDFFNFWIIYCYRFHNRWLHFDVIFGWKSNYMLVKLTKNVIKKVNFCMKSPICKTNFIFWYIF